MINNGSENDNNIVVYISSLEVNDKEIIIVPIKIQKQLPKGISYVDTSHLYKNIQQAYTLTLLIIHKD